MPDHPIPSAALPLDSDAMAQVARRSLEVAKQRGASDAEVEVSAAVGQSVTVRRANGTSNTTGQGWSHVY